MDFFRASCGKRGHIQRALAKADNCHAFVVENIQRTDVALGDYRSVELFLAGEGRAVGVREVPVHTCAM